MEAVQGIDRIILFRKLSEASTKAATKLAYQTDHSIGITNDGTVDDTKDGAVHSAGNPAYDFNITSIMARGDEEVKNIKNAVLDGDMYEFWEIDRVEEGTADNVGKFAATYYRGRFTSFSTSNGVNNSVELSLDVQIVGRGQDGWATLTEDQAEVVQYTFQDTTITPAG
jgi:TP901-1 family phage major tail protein